MQHQAKSVGSSKIGLVESETVFPRIFALDCSKIYRSTVTAKYTDYCEKAPGSIRSITTPIANGRFCGDLRPDFPPAFERIRR